MNWLVIFFLMTKMTLGTDPSSKGLVDENFKKEDFKKHMLQHFHPGCPANSQCSQSLGAKLNFWEKSLKEKDIKSFVKKYGVPVSSWSLIETPSEDEQIVLWDSPCKHHRKKDPKEKAIRYAISFEKKLNNLNREQKYFREVILKRKNEIIRFLGPRDSYPVSLSNSSVHFIQDYNGYYYNLFINKKGNIDVDLKLIKVPESKNIQCPDYFQSQNEFAQKIYQGPICKEIWNTDLKKYEIIQLGWSC